MDQIIDEKIQKELNTPLKDDSARSEEDKGFLELLMKLIRDGKIDLYKASTLINPAVYQNLTEEKKGKADFEAMNLLSTIREIKGLFEAGFQDTYQLWYMVEKLRLTKERLEADQDLFII
ncbi:hypothetical protein HYW82_00900 [Candidatus Peregrinibacteria bacterium]|nr:hypothetical protein [Candidatus Peregrinibacteria bacterium]